MIDIDVGQGFSDFGDEGFHAFERLARSGRHVTSEIISQGHHFFEQDTSSCVDGVRYREVHVGVGDIGISIHLVGNSVGFFGDGLHRGGNTEKAGFAGDGVKGLGIEMTTGPLVLGARAVMGDSEEGGGHSFLGTGRGVSLFTGSEAEVLVGKQVIVGCGRNLGLLWDLPPTRFVEHLADKLPDGNHFGGARGRDVDFGKDSKGYLFVGMVGVGAGFGGGQGGEAGGQMDRDNGLGREATGSNGDFVAFRVGSWGIVVEGEVEGVRVHSRND